MFSMSRLLGAGLIFAALVLAGLCGCVTSSGGSSGGGGGGFMGGGGGKNPAIIKIDGREVKADEFIKSPVFRQALRQWAAIEHIKSDAAAAGVKADSVEVEKKIAEQKSQMSSMGGMKWEDMLKQQGMLDAEVTEMMVFQDLNKKLAEHKAANISDEELQKEWDQREEEFRGGYAAEKFLPESKKKELMFADVKDWIKEQLVKERSMQLEQDMFMEALKTVKLEFLPLSSDEQKTYYDLIIGSQLPEEEVAPAEDEAASEETGAEAEAASEGSEAAGDPAAAASKSDDDSAATPPTPDGAEGDKGDGSQDAGGK